MGLCKDGYWRESERHEGKKYIGCAGRTDRATGKPRTDREMQLAALKDLARKITAAQSGEMVLDKSVTVQKWSETWLSVYIKPRVRAPGQPKTKRTMTEKSYNTYEEKLRLYILPAIGALKMQDVKDVHLRNILNGEAGKSKSHVNRILLILKAMFRQAYASRVIPYDPAVGLELPVVSEGKRRSLTERERALLHRAAQIHRCGLWVETLLATGMRPGESAPLQVKDFDFGTGFVSVDKDVESGTYSVADPKTKAGVRKVPLPSELAERLRAAFGGRGPFEYAFPQADGKRMKTERSIQNDWRSFRRCMDILGGAKTVVYRKTRAGGRGREIVTRQVRTCVEHGYEAAALGRIMTVQADKVHGSVLADDLVLYDLRHTFCTDCKKKGLPLDVTMYLMGHADVRMTANVYGHNDDQIAAIAARYINPPEELPVKEAVKKASGDE